MGIILTLKSVKILIHSSQLLNLFRSRQIQILLNKFTMDSKRDMF
jgi:hypothetical protein